MPCFDSVQEVVEVRHTAGHDEVTQRGAAHAILLAKEPHMRHPRIKRDSKIMMGKPVIAGTRITVEHVLRCLASGDTVEHILANYSHLTVEDIRAAQAYAADYLAHEGIIAAE
jgi:uncharacterized protein (DUF433 family)